MHYYRRFNSQSDPQVLRIAIRSLASPMLGGTATPNGAQDRAVTMFMCALQRMIKTAPIPIVCLVTYPVHLHSQNLTIKLRRLSDNVVTLESFKCMVHVREADCWCRRQ
jgi:hypothetical protein